jgi:error-prone DNA polymerase
LKVDVLALGMLSAIRRALEFVAKRRGIPVLRMQDIPREDPEVYEMCCHADTIGVFQIESRAQQSMLPRMQPRKFYDLVIEVAIVRPAPTQGGMVHPYLRRRQNLEPVDYPKEEIKKALERTLGVPIFQEQVTQLAMIAARYSADEADQLRRPMAAWRRRGNLRAHQEDLMRRMLERGYTQEFATRICSQIEGFGDYGFPESHAASFAVLVYCSAWDPRCGSACI